MKVKDLEHQFDGLILDERTAIQFADHMMRTDTPIVVLGNAEDVPLKPRKNVVFVHFNNREIGRLGARHLVSLGKFRAYAFISFPRDCSWSRQRLAGFREFLSERSLAVQTPGEVPLADFLAALPKPAAVMAAYDGQAVETISACNDQNISIPRQLSILGVDNDELLCNISSPSLSSVMPNHRQKGYLAAQALDLLLRAKCNRPATDVVCPNFQLIVRESTSAVPTSTYVVDRALEFIHANALRKLSVDDVVAHLGISKPLAYLRFQEAGAGTIANTILKARLAEVAKRLRASETPISHIASQCSFNNLQHLANAFKRQYGQSMTAYRRASKTIALPL